MRFKYVLSEVALGLWRNVTMTFAMIITMTVSLAMLGASLVMFFEVRDMKNYYYYDLEVSIFFKTDATDDQINALREEVEGDPLVKEAEYENKNEAYKRFREQFKDAPELVAATTAESLQASLRVKLNDPEQYRQIRDKYQGKDGVDSVVDQRQVLEKLFDILGSLQTLALVIALVQGLAALMLVINTIQVAAYSKRREVAIMKLVGASNWFVQAPFVLEAVFAGVLGSILAWLTLCGAKWLVIDGALKPLFQAGVVQPLGWTDIHLMLPLLAGVAAVISAVTGWITLRFYIKH